MTEHAVTLEGIDYDVLPIAVLHVDTSYQRELRERIVKDILAQGYDLNAADGIIVSERPPLSGMTDPRYYIVDGQHRVKAAERSGETEVIVRIVRFKGGEAKIRQQEAELRGKRGYRKADTPIERFKHRLAAGNDESMAIDKLVESFSAHIALNPNTRGKDGIQAISTLEKLYRKNTLETVLDLIRRGWDTFDGRAGESAALEALNWFVTKHQGKFNKDHLVRRLAANSPDAIHARGHAIKAAMGGSLWKNYYRAIVEAYNHRAPKGVDKLVPVEF